MNNLTGHNILLYCMRVITYFFSTWSPRILNESENNNGHIISLSWTPEATNLQNIRLETCNLSMERSA